jgi:wyosine [tRNA(Phe)-imidazoG37] synthetase (radical SAM superfamily)
MRKFKLLSLSLILFLLLACSSEKAPSQTYEEYNSRIIHGINYDDDKAYYTKRKQDEVETKIPQYMETMKKSRDEVFKVYLDFSKELAKRKAITLVKEVVARTTAVLKYSQTDSCGKESTSQEKQTL